MAFPDRSPTNRPSVLLGRLLDVPGHHERLTHVERVPARDGRHATWPPWVPGLLQRRLEYAGVNQPWEHQIRAAEYAWAGQTVIVATGTASGKSLAYQLPALAAVLGSDAGPAPEGEPGVPSSVPNRTGHTRDHGAARGHACSAAGGPGRSKRARQPRAAPTVLYVSPTKALAADQLSAVRGLRLTGVRAARFDGDTPAAERDWIRTHANYVLTNPDMLHHSLLPRHGKWAGFFRGLRYVVVDECHGYRGVFGSHVAQILRRLRRICTRYGADPTFVLASATISDAPAFAERLTGIPAREVGQDTSPRGATEIALWEPPLTQLTGENGAPVRRTATAEAADVLADLVACRASTLVFARSRRGAEAVSLSARRTLGERSADTEPLAARVAAYRAGFLPEERRRLEHSLRSGDLTGLAATNALELGIDISGLDAVVMAGWPGTRASMWQQAGRAGRAGQEALAVLVARDDPLDTYLVHHPEALFGRPVEAAVVDPANPYILGPHLCCAAAELPLTERELPMFGAVADEILSDLVARGMLRQRADGWYWTRSDRASDLADIRGSGGPPVYLIEAETGRLLGTVDEPAAHSTAHAGAVYLHQGESYVVRRLDLDEHVAFLDRADPDYITSARDVTEIRVDRRERCTQWGAAAVAFGTAAVTQQVIAYQRRRVHTGEILGEEPLDMPPRTLRTRAVWWTLPEACRQGLEDVDLAGAAHAAEHASIGLLPLFATCDRWDIGGVSTANHPDTGELTVFVYDGYDGGAGFAERGYEAAPEWLTATRQAIASCGCDAGCPSCIQSPKCGNGNDPLDKHGAIRLLDALLDASRAAAG